MTSPDETDANKLLNPLQIHSNTFNLPTGSMKVDDEYENDLFIIIIHRSTVLSYPDDILTKVAELPGIDGVSQYAVVFHTKVSAGDDIPSGITIEINSSSERGGLFAFKYRGLDSYTFTSDSFSSGNMTKTYDEDTIKAIFFHVGYRHTNTNTNSSGTMTNIYSLTSSYYVYGFEAAPNSAGNNSSRFGIILPKHDHPFTNSISITDDTSSGKLVIGILTFTPLST